MTLALEIEYLSGVSFAAIGPDSAAPDWPPQPDRIFSALVATWASRGRDLHEADALEWLERLSVPLIVASDAEPRTSATVFVPPNDSRSDRQKHAAGVLPALRSRQARRFPAARPHDALVRVVWVDAEPTEATLAALERLARDTAYIGHSTSLTRCRFVIDDRFGRGDGRAPQRRLYAGRFRELRDAYAILESSGGKRGRPLPGARVTPEADIAPKRINLFGPRWLLLEHIGGEMPDIRASAVVARTIRDALLSGYQRIGLGDRIPSVISGHAPDGSPSRTQHPAIVPLPFAGFPHADGHVTGFALVPPEESTILDDAEFRQSLRMLAPVDEHRGRRVLTITTKAGTPSHRAFSLGLSPTFEASRRSLDPLAYTRSARIFATVTPIALDRHLKEKGQRRDDEIAAQIAAACRNLGLVEPDRIVADKHSALEGMPSAYPSGHAPDWTRWQLPRSLASRQLTHATLRFPVAVEGPVILGAGRFLGLGLCRPLDDGAV